MAKRRTFQPKKLRDRRSGQSPYRRHGKREYKYDLAALARRYPLVDSKFKGYGAHLV